MKRLGLGYFGICLVCAFAGLTERGGAGDSEVEYPTLVNDCHVHLWSLERPEW